MLHKYDVLYDTLENPGQEPTLNIIYNEDYTVLKNLLQKRRTLLQLAPPHSHRRNAAEPAIRTFRNHFMAGLASVDNFFAMYLWCPIVELARITINLL